MKKILLILITVFFFQGNAQQKDLTLEDSVLGYYKGLYPDSMRSLQFVSDSKYVYRIGTDFIIKDFINKTDEKISLASLQATYPNLNRLPRLMDIDENTILFNTQNTIIKFNYKTNQELSKVSYPKEAENIDYNDKKALLAYTIKNNLYLATTSNSKIEITTIKDENIVSGQAIARYEFGISKGTFWSPNGSYLAFYQKDETNVTSYPLVDVSTYPATLDNVKYPMAGQGSEIPKIGVYNVSKKNTIYLDIDASDEHYLTNLSWTPDEKCVLVAEVNRNQDHYDLNTYKVKDGKKEKTLFSESNNRWVEPENDAVFLPNSKTAFLWLSEKDGFKNIYLCNTKKKQTKQITSFKFVIKSILGFDSSGKNVLVSATGEDGKETQVYKVNINKANSSKITNTAGTHRAQQKGNYLLDNFSNLTTPREISLINTKTLAKETIYTAINPLTDYKMGAVSFVNLKSKDGFDLYGRLIKPANFDPSKKYPVLVYVYGGTHAQMVTNSWLAGASLWMHWLATQKDYIVFTLDNRGSANRGFAFESIIHRKAGEAAMEDQLIGIDYLTNLGYANMDKVAVYGWSYGGFMSSSLVMRHPTVFTTAVAGGPVTDWKYYEVMYGERYMDTPKQNPEGYANARVGKYLENLKGKLLIIHGSVDPTVVPQHSMTLLKEAVEKNVQIDFFTYPMHPHNVRGKDRVHLMNKVLNYVLDNNK